MADTEIINIPFSLSTVQATFLSPTIIHIELNRPSSLNAMNKQMFSDIKQLFTYLNTHPLLRVVILTGSGKLFTAGLDLKEAISMFQFDNQVDQARKSIQIYNLIKDWQESLSILLKLRVPVLVGIHSYCIGGGVDLISAADIRYCTEDAKFSIKEIDIGMVADIGTFPRIPTLMSNEGFVREMAFTGRQISAEEAFKFGLVSKVFKNKEELINGLKAVAEEISTKSPVAVYSIKKVMNKTKFGNMEEGLEYVALMNMSMIFTNDVSEAITANLSKGKAKFSKL
jgi:delta(3,5)-delta(2,4)-dienoyl-CoA isomerase